MTPKISVVMPVYNGERYLAQAIESILAQSYKDFELIIINDGSSDSTDRIVKNFSDRRIVYIQNESNLGLSKSFNTGIQAAQGEYIARMDADDICLKNRFEKQVEFLNKNSNIGIVGTSVILIDESGKQLKKHKMPKSHLDIKWKSLFSTPLVHPSIMARSEILKENPYDEKTYNSEDYELWSRLLFEKNIKFANIEESLLLYRVHKKSFTQSLNIEKVAASAENSLRNIRRYYKLSELESKSLMRLRESRALSLKEAAMLYLLYKRISASFAKIEHKKPSIKAQIFFLLKNLIRQ